MERDEIIKFFRSVGVFAKPYVDVGAQQRSLDTARILPECFVAILNGELVFALLSINLRANVERWPQFRINAKCGIHIPLCTRNITIAQLLARMATQLHGRALVSGGLDDDWYTCPRRGCQR